MPTNHTFILTGAALVSVLALGACNKAGGSAPAAVDAANNAAATSNAAVAGAENATAAGVGQVSAATTTTAGGFVTAAATSDMYEIAAGKIAQAKSTNPQVKKFAARMIHDHSATTAAIKKIIAGPGVSATPPTDLDERHKGLINDLNAAAPADFDKTYMDQQVAGHDEALTLFKGFADHGDNDALKAFASSTAPKIQAHDDMAKQIRAALK